MRGLLADVRLAARSLGKSPLFLIVATVTLALSIGLNTAVFSVVDAVVFRPLPFPEPERLVAMCELERGEVTDWCSASVPNVYDIAARSRSISVAGVARSWPFVMKTQDGVEGISGGLASGEAFRALRVAPHAGRLFEPSDIGRQWQRVAVLSFEFWRTRFGARSTVIGESLILDDEPHVIVGVLPADTRIPHLEDVQVWRPVHVDPADEERRDWRGFLAFARLRDGATLREAQREIASIAEELQRQHFPAKPGWTVGAKSWHDVIVGPVRGAMTIFLGAVAFVLLIGCANVANLLLARATGRERELAVRAALGASRARLVRGVLAESLVLALLGTAAGLLLGWWSSRAFVALAPQGIPRMDQVGLDSRVFAFAAILAMITALLVGLVPALRATRPNLQGAISHGSRGGPGQRATRVGAVLIVGEIALAVILVTGAGLLGRSFVTQLRWAPGFEQDHLLTVWTFASMGKFQNREQVAGFMVRAENELRSIPAVTAVGSGSAGPLLGGDGEMNFTIDGRPAPTEGTRQSAFWFDIGPGYFRALGLPVVHGRDIAESDVIGAPVAAVVNESFVRRYLGEDNPIGRRIHMVEHDLDVTIVGVVRDVPPVRPGDATRPEIYWSNRQVPRPATYYFIRTSGEPSAALGVIRARLKAIDPDLQVGTIRPMSYWLSRQLVRPRFGAALLGTFAVLALVLAAIGTYGLLAYTVAQQSKAIGIRMALGAKPQTIVREVLRRGMRLTAIAIAIGVAGALALTRLLEGLLAGVTPTDPLSFAVAVTLLLGAAALACLIPASRASHVDPMAALRDE